MDYLEEQSQYSWLARRRDPAVRSWFPSPIFLLRKFILFFISKPCSVRYRLGLPVAVKVPRHIPKYSPVTEAEVDEEVDSSDVENTPAWSHSDFPFLRDAIILSDSSFRKRSPYHSQTQSRDECKETIHSKATTHISYCDGHGHYEERSGFLSLGAEPERDLSKPVDACVGPCPCFLNETDPYGLRKFCPPGPLTISSPDLSVQKLHHEYGIVTWMVHIPRGVSEVEIRRRTQKEIIAQDILLVTVGLLTCVMCCGRATLHPSWNVLIQRLPFPQGEKTVTGLQDLGRLTKQCTSLLDEVDRLEASLSAMEEIGSASQTSSKEVRVVFYGDMGSALRDQLPQSSVSESLYTMNLNLLHKLDAERRKVEKRDEDHHAMSSQLKDLVTTVDSFQHRFEEHMLELRSGIPSRTPVPYVDRAGGTESGFGDFTQSDMFSVGESNTLSEDEMSLAAEKANIHSTTSQLTQPADWKLASELRNIVTDLHKVIGDISARETKWSDEQKSWAVFSGDLCSRLVALLRLVVGLADSLAAHRHFAESAFAQLKRDLTGSASSLQYLAALSGLREQRIAGKLTSFRVEKNSEATGVISEYHDIHQKVISWQEKSCQVDRPDDLNLEELKHDYEVLEEKYQSTLKRLQNGGQEKLLLESTLEKLKDELQLAQLEKESLLRKNERTLMSLNNILSEKSAIEAAMGNVSAELETVSTIRWTLESSGTSLRDTIKKLQMQNEDLVSMLSRGEEEKKVIEFAILNRDDTVAELTKEVVIHKAVVEKLNAEMAQINVEMNCMRDELVTAASTIEELRAAAGRLKAENSKVFVLEEQLESVNQEIVALQQTLEGKDFALKRADDDVTKEQTASVQLRAELGVLQADLSNEKSRNQLLHQSISEQEVRLTRIERLKTDVEIENALVKEKSMELRKETESLYASWISKCDEANQQASDLQVRIDHVAFLDGRVQAMETAEADLMKSKEANSFLEAKIAMLMLSDEKNVEQKDAEIEQMLRELNVSKNWIQENQREIDVLRSEQIHSVKDVARLNVDLSAKSKEVAVAHNRIRVLTEEKAFLQESADLCSCLKADNEVLSTEVGRLEKANSGLQEQLDTLSRDLKNSCGEVTLYRDKSVELEADNRSLQAIADSSRISCLALDVDLREVRQEISVVKEEKSVLEEHLVTYSRLVRLLVQLIVERNQDHSAMDNSHGSIAIFTPDGVIYGPEEGAAEGFQEDDTFIQRPPVSPIEENDSGFVGSMNSTQDDRGSAEANRHVTSVGLEERNLIDLVQTLELRRNHAPPVLQPSYSVVLKDIRRVQSAINESDNDKTHADSLQKTLHDLTANLAAERRKSQRLTDERDELNDKVEDFMVEVKILKKSLEGLEKENKANQNDVKSKEDVATELKKLLKNAENEIEVLNRSYSTSANTVRELNNNFGTQLQEKENEVASLHKELELSQVNLQDVCKENSRNEERLKGLLKRVTETETIVSDLTSKLTEAETQVGDATHLAAKEEALNALEQALDARIHQIQDREDSVRKLEQQVSGFVTDQLALTNRECAVREQVLTLESKETSLNEREINVSRRCEEIRCAENSLQQRELDSANCDLTRVVSDHRLVTDDLESRLKQHQCQINNLARACEDAESNARRYKAEAKSLQNTNFGVGEGRDGTSICDAVRFLRKLPFGQRILDQACRSHTPMVLSLGGATSCPQRPVLDSSQGVTLRAATPEASGLGSGFQDRDIKWSRSKRYSDDLDERLQAKAQSRGSLEERFNVINTLYADTLGKYRCLSESYDELQIQMVRGRDEYRNAKRELDNIMYVVGRQLGDFSPSMPASAAEGSADSKMYPAITKDMMAELRWRLEQVFEEGNRLPRRAEPAVSQNLPSIAGNQTTPPTGRRSRYPRSSRKSTPLTDHDDFRENEFRGKVMEQLFEGSSRQNIEFEEALLGKMPNSTMFGSPKGDGCPSSSLSADDLSRRQAGQALCLNDRLRSQFIR